MKLYKKPSRITKKTRVFWRNLPEAFTYNINQTSHFDDLVVFIVGAGRSGTTLLKQELSRRYKISFPVELPALGRMIKEYYWWRLIYQKKDIEVSRKFVFDSFIRNYNVDVNTKDILGFKKVYNIVKDYGLFDFELPSGGIAENKGICNAFSTLYIELIRKIIGIGSLDEVLGDKTPWNTFHLRKISTNFPSAKFIHVVRDGREVAVSYERSLGELMNLDISDGIRRWVDSIRKVQNSKSFLNGRLIEVRYEDLIRDPVFEIEKLASQLELEKREEVLESKDQDSTLQQHKNLNKKILKNNREARLEEINIKQSDMKRMRKYLIYYGYING